MRSDYEERRQRRIDSMRRRAEQKKAESNSAYSDAQSMAGQIPLGQPILVGHHSERRHRNHLKRIDRKYRKSAELDQQAESLERRANFAESNHAISSDDPNAIEKLNVRIAKAERYQEKMKAANKLVRKNDRPGLIGLGYTEAQVEELLKPDFAGRIGYPSYALQNNNANIRRMKKRVEALEKEKNESTTDKTVGAVRIIDSVEDNRLQLYFPGKPSDEFRKRLKSSGFRWARSLGCWQRHRSNAATWEAERLVKAFNEEN